LTSGNTRRAARGPGQQAHASRSLTSALTAAESDPQGQVPAPGSKTGSDPANLPASQAARHHPTPPAFPHGPQTPHRKRGNPRQQPTRTRRRFHANATIPDEDGCKTVGSAYVGSNPTPATTCENGPLAVDSRLCGPFSSCPAVCHLVTLQVPVSRCPRTHSGRRPAARTVGVHRRLSTDGRAGRAGRVFRLEGRRVRYTWSGVTRGTFTRGGTFKLRQQARVLKQKALTSFITAAEALNSPHQA